MGSTVDKTINLTTIASTLSRNRNERKEHLLLKLPVQTATTSKKEFALGNQPTTPIVNTSIEWNGILVLERFIQNTLGTITSILE